MRIVKQTREVISEKKKGLITALNNFLFLLMFLIVGGYFYGYITERDSLTVIQSLFIYKLTMYKRALSILDARYYNRKLELISSGWIKNNRTELFKYSLDRLTNVSDKLIKYEDTSIKAFSYLRMNQRDSSRTYQYPFYYKLKSGLNSFLESSYQNGVYQYLSSVSVIKNAKINELDRKLDEDLPLTAERIQFHRINYNSLHSLRVGSEEIIESFNNLSIKAVEYRGIYTFIPLAFHLALWVLSSFVSSICMWRILDNDGEVLHMFALIEEEEMEDLVIDLEDFKDYHLREFLAAEDSDYEYSESEFYGDEEVEDDENLYSESSLGQKQPGKQRSKNQKPVMESAIKRIRKKRSTLVNSSKKEDTPLVDQLSSESHYNQRRSIKQQSAGSRSRRSSRLVNIAERENKMIKSPSKPNKKIDKKADLKSRRKSKAMRQGHTSETLSVKGLKKKALFRKKPDFSGANQFSKFSTTAKNLFGLVQAKRKVQDMRKIRMKRRMRRNNQKRVKKAKNVSRLAVGGRTRARKRKELAKEDEEQEERINERVQKLKAQKNHRSSGVGCNILIFCFAIALAFMIGVTYHQYNTGNSSLFMDQNLNKLGKTPVSLLMTFNLMLESLSILEYPLMIDSNKNQI